MQLKLLAAGTRLPGWVNAGFEDYAKRMPRSLALVLHEVPVAKRTPTRPATRCIDEERAQFERRIGQRDTVVALAVDGRAPDTEGLAKLLGRWREAGNDACFLVGGPDGLADALLARADYRWSLSPLTMPHGLVRVVVAEQLYRAWSVLEGHPYHRA